MIIIIACIASSVVLALDNYSLDRSSFKATLLRNLDASFTAIFGLEVRRPCLHAACTRTHAHKCVCVCVCARSCVCLGTLACVRTCSFMPLHAVYVLARAQIPANRCTQMWSWKFAQAHTAVIVDVAQA